MPAPISSAEISEVSPSAAEPFGGRAAQVRILVGQLRLEERHARRVRQMRQRVERRPRALPLP